VRWCARRDCLWEGQPVVECCPLITFTSARFMMCASMGLSLLLNKNNIISHYLVAAVVDYIEHCC